MHVSILCRTGRGRTLLNDGRVLVAGGADSTSAELFDPASGAFTATGSTVVNPSHRQQTRTAPSSPSVICKSLASAPWWLVLIDRIGYGVDKIVLLNPVNPQLAFEPS